LIKLGQKMQKNRKFPSTPNNGGQMLAIGLSTITGQQEVVKTGRHSKRQLKTPSKHSSTTKFKKSQIKAAANRS